jgi:ribosomal protein L37AE/L43A
MTESTESLFGMLADTPKLTGARCKGRAPLFDCDDDDPEIIQYAIWQCRACPALAACSAWVDSLPPSQRPLGVTAAVMRRPKKPRRSRATKPTTEERESA